MRADRKDPNIAALRRFKPTKFTATLRDGSQRELVLSTKANKWELLSGVLEALPWERIEALDDKGGILGVVDRDIEEEEDEGYGVSDEVAVYFKMLKEAQQTTLHEARLMFADRDKRDAARDDAVTNAIHAMKEAYEAMAEGYQMTIKMASLTAAAGGPAGDDKVMQMMQMAAMMFTNKAPSGNVPPRPAPPTIPATIPAKSSATEPANQKKKP